MYKNYEEAKAAAMDVINRHFNGEKLGCVVTESKLKKNSRYTFWNFHFHDEDTNGQFIQNEDGTWSRMFRI